MAAVKSIGTTVDLGRVARLNWSERWIVNLSNICSGERKISQFSCPDSPRMPCDILKFCGRTLIEKI